MIATSSCSRPSRPPRRPRQRQRRRNSRLPSSRSVLTENTQAVSSLQGAVTDLKTNNTSLASTIQDNQAKVEKQITNPDVIHFKGVTLSPTGSYLAGETVYRTHATGGDIPTPFSALPYEHADAYALSEFYGTARQSRVALMAEGKTGSATLRGYYEADWLGTGVSSNNNESNSYVFRQRVLWGQAALNNGWAFTGGQLWSLATEDKKGISNLSGDILTPLDHRSELRSGLRLGAPVRLPRYQDLSGTQPSASQPRIPSCSTPPRWPATLPTPSWAAPVRTVATHNAAISTCSPSTSIVNYTNEANGGVNTYLPVYKTVNSCANIANFSFNVMPDFIVKGAFDPSFGHFELFGILRSAHETVYPGETTNGNLYGGLTDITTGKAVTPALTTAGSYNNSIALGGLGASGRVTVLNNRLTLGLKGLYGPGVGRYGASTLSDVTSAASGEFSPLHNTSALSTVEFAATPRLTIYLNYGGDYAGRSSWSGTTLGAPTATKNAAGVWGGHWSAPAVAPVGYGSYYLSNSACLTTSAPGYNGSSTGFYPGGSCGAQTKDVQEATAGYWYDFYRGDYGRVRLGMQYAYALRQSWTGAVVSANGPNGVGTKGIDNMFWTSFRYYLP